MPKKLTQRQIENLIDKYAPTLIKQMQLEDYNIEWFVRPTSRTKYLKGEALIDAFNAEITIITKNCTGTKDCVATIVHELCHVLLAPLNQAVPALKSLRKVNRQIHNEEEEIVQKLEAFFMKHWKNI